PALGGQARAGSALVGQRVSAQHGMRSWFFRVHVGERAVAGAADARQRIRPRAVFKLSQRHPDGGVWPVTRHQRVAPAGLRGELTKARSQTDDLNAQLAKARSGLAALQQPAAAKVPALPLAIEFKKSF